VSIEHSSAATHTDLASSLPDDVTAYTTDACTANCNGASSSSHSAEHACHDDCVVVVGACGSCAAERGAHGSHGSCRCCACDTLSKTSRSCSGSDGNCGNSSSSSCASSCSSRCSVRHPTCDDRGVSHTHRLLNHSCFCRKSDGEEIVRSHQVRKCSADTRNSGDCFAHPHQGSESPCSAAASLVRIESTCLGNATYASSLSPEQVCACSRNGLHSQHASCNVFACMKTRLFTRQNACEQKQNKKQWCCTCDQFRALIRRNLTWDRRRWWCTGTCARLGRVCG
jgi:hypothetical protein